MKPVRMIDVANAAGVSMTTASYVLNNRDVPIPASTRERVLEAARQLGFRPNKFAQNLAHSKSGLIGVLTPLNPSPFHAQLTGELSRTAGKLGYTLIFESEGEVEVAGIGSKEAVDRLLQWRVDGLLLWHEGKFPGTLPDLPVLMIGPKLSYPDGVSYVCIDLYEGARQAAKHLVDLGHSSICFVGHDDDDPRWRALCDVLNESELAEPFRIRENGEREQTRIDVGTFARANPDVTAYLCISDVQAMVVFRALRDCGMSIPQDRSIVSCDESWAAENMDPTLTSVAVPFAEIGESALKSLVDQIETPSRSLDKVVITPHLNVRGSSSTPQQIDF